MNLKDGYITINGLYFEKDISDRGFEALYSRYFNRRKSTANPETVLFETDNAVDLGGMTAHMTVTFTSSRLSAIEIRNGDKRLQLDPKNCSESKKNRHITANHIWLEDQLGAPHEEKENSISFFYPWGSITSQYSQESFFASIIIHYKNPA